MHSWNRCISWTWECTWCSYLYMTGHSQLCTPPISLWKSEQNKQKKINKSSVQFKSCSLMSWYPLKNKQTKNTFRCFSTHWCRCYFLKLMWTDQSADEVQLKTKSRFFFLYQPQNHWNQTRRHVFSLLLFSVSFNVLSQVGEQVQLCHSRY